MPLRDDGFNRRKRRFVADVIDKPFHYFVDKWGCLSPRSVPKNGSLVAIETCTKTGGNVVITEDWVVDGVILPMSVIMIWTSGILFTFQVVPSEKRGYGVLSLINRTNTEMQPGVHARTNRTGGTRNNYSG